MKRFLLIFLSLALCLPVLTGCTPRQVKNLNEGEIKRISVSSLPECYEYSFTDDDARAIADYFSDLNMIPRLFGLNKGGMSWVILIEYEDGSETTVNLFGNIIRVKGGMEYLINRDEAAIFEDLLENLNQK